MKNGRRHRKAVGTDTASLRAIQHQALSKLPALGSTVLYAFGNARPGDIFIKKAPASRIDVLVGALHELLGAKNREIKTIGIRHGEKMYETLATSAELARSEDLGSYYRIAMDERDLNYTPFESSGDKTITSLHDYHSSNTEQLDVAGVKALLLRLPEIQSLLGGA